MQIATATATAILLTALMPGFVAATHKEGDLCTKSKYYNTFGCSNNACDVLQCIPEPNGGGMYYWAKSSSCKGLGLCQNGACNGDVDSSNSC